MIAYNHTREDSYMAPCPECRRAQVAILGIQLARAIILFYGSEWTNRERAAWVMATGTDEATTKALGNMARKILDEEEKCNF